MKDHMYTYVFFNTVNGKVYIGQSVNPHVRRRGHIAAARRGCNHHLYRAMRVHGVEAFTFTLLTGNLTPEDTNAAERYWIEYFQSTESTQGYNVDAGGHGGSFPRTAEHRAKIGDTLRGRKRGPSPLRGVRRSSELRAKLSKIRRENRLCYGEKRSSNPNSI